jgi:hypothetical protein
VGYFEYWRAVPFNLTDFLGAFFLFALPVGYVCGFVPTLLAASLYCALLIANTGLRGRRPLARACVGAVCGGLASWVWFGEWLNVGQPVYGLVGALVMGALSLGHPQLAQLVESGLQKNMATNSGTGFYDRPAGESRVSQTLERGACPVQLNLFRPSARPWARR